MAKTPISTPFRFDGTNPAAQRVAERQAARMVTNVSAETRAAIRVLVTRAIREGIPVYDAARAIKQMIGLTRQQGQAALNHRRALIDQGHTPERVNTLFDRYVDKKLAERGQTIARWEIMDALGTGQRESWKQARKDGRIDKTARKGIVITPDERLCPVCAALENTTVPLEEDFITLLGPRSGPPFHQRCRCGQILIP